MKKSKFYLFIATILTMIISFVGSKGEVVENLEIPAGIGYDIEKASDDTVDYNISMLDYAVEGKDKVTTTILSGKGVDIGRTRETRSLRSSRKFILGLNRVFISSEDAARYGFHNIVDILLNNAQINDRAVWAICNGKAEDIFKLKIQGYSSSAEYIEGMVKNLRQFNFFPMQYTFVDMVVRMDAEGRNMLLPYIEVIAKSTEKGIEKNIETTGLAIFRGDKFIGKADINEAKIINILRENNVKGMLTLRENSKKYINCYSTSKRKVKCYKEDGNYKFIIDLDIKGEIASNDLDESITKDAKDLKKFEEQMKTSVEKMCNESLDKIKCEYKTDVLELGRVAAAKYGRGTGVDWNKVICRSDIKVNVKFSVTSIGRGSY